MKKVREGYKITEFGEIPEEWNISKLSEITELITKGATPMTYGFDFEDEGINFIKVENIMESGKIDKNSLLKISEECNNKLSRSKIQKGDILMSIAGTLGRTAIISEEVIPANTNQALAIIRLKKINNVDYINKTLSSSYIKKHINMIGTVGAQPNLSLKQIGDFNILLPSIKEQEKIASILSTVDEQIDNVDALIEKNKELKKGLMQTLLTKGIGHTKFKKTEIGEVPSEWYIKSIDEITKEVYRYPTYYGIEYVEEGIAEIRGELLNDDASIKKESFRYISEKTAKKFPRTKLEGGDIVISVRGTIGKVGYITEELAGSNITANLLRVSMNRNIMNEHFVKQLFLSDIMKRKFDEITTATTIKTFKVPEFKQIILAIPTKDEQDKIASILLEVDKKIEEHENKKQKLEELKKGLMQQLLTGRIRV